MRSERLTTVIKFIKKGEKIMKRSLSLILALAMTLTLLAGCGNKAKNNDPGSSGEKEMLTIAVNEDISGLDPFAQNTSLQNTYTILMYDSLLALDPATGEIVPGLAESYDIVSATEYVFHLRSGVKFHNGEDLKASDVKFSLERAAASTGMASKVSQIDRVEVEDDSTVRIFLNVPSTTILNNLAFCGTSIMCEEWCNANQGSFKHNGTGPYVFREWNSGESIIFDRNDNYWGEKGAMKTLKFVVMNEANSRTIALETGEIDVNAFPAAIALVFSIIAVAKGGKNAKKLGIIGLILSAIGLVLNAVILAYGIWMIRWDHMTIENLSSIQNLNPANEKDIIEWLQQFIKVDISGMVN